jgi:hypothetical protein
LTPVELQRLLAGRTVSDVPPWSSGKLHKIDQWYRTTCDSLAAALKLKVEVESRGGGCCYASFLDAWFHEPTPQRRASSAKEQHLGETRLLVMLCRLAPLFCLSEGSRNSSTRPPSQKKLAITRSSITMYADNKLSPATSELGQQLQTALEARGLKRVRPEDLNTPLPDDVMHRATINSPPYTEFDAYFHWHD